MSIKLQRAMFRGINAVNPAAARYMWRGILARKITGKYKRGLPLSIVMEDRNDGFFSLFFQVLGLADVCIAGRHNFELAFCNGPYVQAEKGCNWWRYYFESSRFEFGPANANIVRIGSLRDQYRFSDYGRALAPETANGIMRQMGLAVRKELLEKVVSFWDANMRGKTVTGLHYRGTDKVRADGKRAESVRVPYEYVLNYLRERHSAGHFFVAADEAPLVEYLMRHLPGRIIAYCGIRSADSRSVHHGSGEASRYQAGEDALIDCLLLSRCGFIARTESNLSLACNVFNPQLAAVNLTDMYRRSM